MKILDVPQSGSVAGVTSSRNRYGQYRRTRAIPVNPASAKQTAVRGNFGTLANLWSQLDDAGRLAWREWADAHPISDSLGQSITLSGFAWFMRAGQVLFACGAAFTGVAPTVDDPGVIGPVLTVASAAALTVTFTGTIPTGGFIEVQGAPPRNQGVSFAQGWRQLAIEQDDATSPLALGAAYAGTFGARAAGQRVWLRLRMVTSEGVYGPWEMVTRIVA